MKTPPPLRAQIFGFAFGLAAVTLVEVGVFGDPWLRALVYAGLVTIGAVAFALIRARRR